MRTPAQIAASRANGAKSKGPVTAPGKRNSSRNAIRHGLFAQTLVLDAEEVGPFHELLDDLLEEHQPQTTTELLLVETICAARWRQQRIWGMQKAAYDYDVAHAPADSAASNPLRAVLSLRNSPESARTHEFILRAEIAHDRQMSRALHRLQKLQEKRASQQSTAAKQTQQSVENENLLHTPNPPTNLPPPSPQPRNSSVPQSPAATPHARTISNTSVSTISPESRLPAITKSR